MVYFGTLQYSAQPQTSLPWMYVTPQIGLLPPKVLRSEAGLDVLAIMPRFSTKRHRKKCPDHADIKRMLAWETYRILLQPLLGGDAEETQWR